MWSIEQFQEAIHKGGDSIFELRNKGSYLVATYVVLVGEAFLQEDPLTQKILRNCRGTILSPEGEILALPYEKFFNLGENHLTDFVHSYQGPLEILVKEDGSMAIPVRIEGQVRWVNRKGITEFTSIVERAMQPNVQAFAEQMVDKGLTPIFEFCSKDHQILIQHPVDRFVLTGIREIGTGRLYSHNEMLQEADPFGVEVVQILSHDGDLNSLVARVTAMEECEGVVLRYPDGEQVKLKTKWYRDRHHYATSINCEKDAVALCLSNMDDILPLLPPAKAQALRESSRILISGIRQHIDVLNEVAKTLASLDPKERAGKIQKQYVRHDAMILFNLCRGSTVEEEIDKVKDLILSRHTSSGPRLDMVRHLWGGAQIPFRATLYEKSE